MCGWGHSVGQSHHHDDVGWGEVALPAMPGCELDMPGVGALHLGEGGLYSLLYMAQKQR